MKTIITVLAALLTTASISLQAQPWTQIGNDIDGEAATDNSGTSVSMSSDGNTVAIGAPWNVVGADTSGDVRIFQWSGNAWIQIGGDIAGETDFDFSGSAVSMSSDGNTVAIGAKFNDGITGNLNDDRGHVRIYEWDGSAWTQKGTDIDGEAVYDFSGFSVSMSSDGNVVVVGAPNNAGTGLYAGHVRIYQWSGSAWIQKGGDIDGEAQSDNSGKSVSISSDGNTVAIGAEGNDGAGSSAGHVRIYQWNGSAWIQKGGDIDGEAADDNSGSSVSLSSDGNTVAIGAKLNDGTTGDVVDNRGHVRIYQWNGSAWIQKGDDIDGEAATDWSGFSVSMSSDGNTLAVGAHGNDGVGFNAGHVRIYTWIGSAWIQQGGDIDAEAGNNFLGWSVSMSSDANTVAIGAPLNDGNGINAGHTRVFKFVCASTIGADIITACDTYTSPSGVYTWATSGTYYDTTFNITGCDSIITLNLTIINSTTGTDIQTACSSYTWINGNTYTANNNTATYILTNGVGCDSVLTLDLTINTIDVSVTDNSPTLTANASGATYQWVDCNNNFAVITGENNQSFTAIVNGSYAVIVSENSCVDTSNCVDVIIAGIYESNLLSDLTIYPNPFSNQVFIEYTTPLSQHYSIRILDAKGVVVFERHAITDSKTIFDRKGLSAGVYFVEVIDEGVLRRKLLVQ
ncbi:MAG TPA: T9SS type A sorting domain-containing protein [Flavobacteriales bacterium]|nr:T9SS type A sorting domain-containing protein [Flavobacteriales bacterium]